MVIGDDGAPSSFLQGSVKKTDGKTDGLSGGGTDASESLGNAQGVDETTHADEEKIWVKDDPDEKDPFGQYRGILGSHRGRGFS